MGLITFLIVLVPVSISFGHSPATSFASHGEHKKGGRKQRDHTLSDY